MKKKLMIGLAVLALAGVVLGRVCAGRRPLKELRAGDILRVTAECWPDLEITLTAEETARLTPLLNGLTVYQKDMSYQEYDGDPTIFSLEKADGTVLRVFAYQPFAVIDGVGYRGKYETLCALDRFAASLNW